jgi:hypothetical protein
MSEKCFLTTPVRIGHGPTNQETPPLAISIYASLYSVSYIDIYDVFFLGNKFLTINSKIIISLDHHNFFNKLFQKFEI